MEIPQVRPGKVKVAAGGGPMTRLVVYFRNAAQGNSAIQMLAALGLPGDRLGVTTPDRIETGQGMLLSIACPDETLIPKVEALCRGHGAEVHRQRDI